MSLSKYQRQEVINYILTNNITNRDEFRQCWKTNKIEGVTQESAESVLSEFKYICKTIGDKELQSANTDLLRKGLKFKDKLNYERKTFYKDLRSINALEELNKELIEAIKLLPKKEVELQESKPITVNGVGVVVLSDLHFNELISTPNNTYDFNIASKRLYKLAVEAIDTFKAKGITKVAVLFLGDGINSDRRQSEIFNMATNRAKACTLAFYILKQFIEHLLNHFNVTIATVSGNESRVVGEEFDTSEILASYSYDYTLEAMLRVYFEENPYVKFVDGEYGEKVININVSNVLITHGVNIKNDREKSVTQLIGRYSQSGINIDYVFFGHMHSSSIGDIYARSSSLCGSNSYSEGVLNLTSRASQLIGVFYPDKTHCITKVDLQNTDGITGYDVVEKLEAYNAKSSSKKPRYIHEV